jgi:DNA-binding response OmpR family regulator
VKKQKTILFLEDEQELLSTVALLLRDNGYRVIDVSKAEDALKIIGKATPDLIIADIKLPGIDGFDFYKEVQKNENCKGVPFVFLTAYNNMKAAMGAKKQGAAEYITKPFDFEYLVARIKNLVPP